MAESSFRQNLQGFAWARAGAVTDDSQAAASNSPFQRFYSSISGGIPVRSNERTNEEEAYFALSRWERFLGFLLCCGGAVVCFMLAFFVGLPLLAIKPRKFAVAFSLGSILFMVGYDIEKKSKITRCGGVTDRVFQFQSRFAILQGPVAHIKHIFTAERLPFTGAYVGSLVGTLYFAVGWRLPDFVIWLANGDAGRVIDVKPIHLVLARTPVEPLDQDPYERLFQQQESRVRWHHVPILSTRLLHLQQLKEIIDLPNPSEHYQGVVITSARAVQAWHEAATMREQASQDQPTQLKEARKATWKDLPFFVVGNPCKQALLQLPTASRWTPSSSLILGADESGTGEKLANFIVHRVKTARSPHTNDGCADPAKDKPFLWLVGDKNRDTVPTILLRAGLKAERVQVYETDVCQDFERVLDETLASSTLNVQEPERHPQLWLALFSPSGAKHCIECLRQRGLLPQRPTAGSTAESSPPRATSVQIKLAAIGPVTQNYLERDEGLKVAAMAQKPEPQALLAALLEQCFPRVGATA
ncbi:protein transport protein sft2 [Microbotryomycetes sp. JL221]|nr:protein transport protein sft2 [Microbotryomycetes sp. JL221]